MNQNKFNEIDSNFNLNILLEKKLNIKICFNLIILKESLKF